MQDKKLSPKEEVAEMMPISKERGRMLAESSKVPEKVEVNKESLDKLIAKVEMLEAVADKGRVFNYQNKGKDKKPSKVSLSIHNKKIVVGWRTIKDELLKHPTTGRVVGEIQEYEILLLDKDDKHEKIIVKGYPSFSDVRYTERIEAEVVSKKENWDGDITFTVMLPDGRKIELASQFIN